MLINKVQLLSSNTVYYPCFDPAYPDSRWQTDFRILPMLFDYIVVPSSHILENRLALYASHELESLYQNGICIGSLRVGQNSIQEFFFTKLEELGNKINQQHEDELLEHAQNYHVLFHRDTSSQSVAFRLEFLRLLDRLDMNPEAEKIISNLPVSGIHVLYREQLDEIIDNMPSDSVRNEVKIARSSAYFAAGASVNMSFLYDPHNRLRNLNATAVPREAFVFLDTLFQRAGFKLRDIERVPITRIIDLYKRKECILFRRLLIRTIKQACSKYSEIILKKNAAERKRQKRFSVGLVIANLCIGAIGFVNLPAGIASFILGNVVLGAAKKLVDFFYQLSEPLLAMEKNIASLLYEYSESVNK